jgi:hypothetical protein
MFSSSDEEFLVLVHLGGDVDGQQQQLVLLLRQSRGQIVQTSIDILRKGPGR